MADKIGIEINNVFYPLSPEVVEFIRKIARERTDYRNTLLRVHGKIDQPEVLGKIETTLVKYSEEGLPKIPYIGEGGEA